MLFPKPASPRFFAVLNSLLTQRTNAACGKLWWNSQNDRRANPNLARLRALPRAVVPAFRHGVRRVRAQPHARAAADARRASFRRSSPRFLRFFGVFSLVFFCRL